MNDDPMEMADRLMRYVDDLIRFRREKDTRRISGRILMIQNVLEKLRLSYEVALFPPGIIERIRREMERADLPASFEKYEF